MQFTKLSLNAFRETNPLVVWLFAQTGGLTDEHANRRRRTAVEFFIV